MEKRWARLAVQAQCSGVLDFREVHNRNGYAEQREELLLAAVEREQDFRAVQLMLQAHAATREENKALVMTLLDEGLGNLQLMGGTNVGLPATGAMDEKQMEQWYTRMRDTHRKRTRQ